MGNFVLVEAISVNSLLSGVNFSNIGGIIGLGNY